MSVPSRLLTGEPWLRLVWMHEPLVEVAALAAVGTDTVRLSAAPRPTGFRARTQQTDFGRVVSCELVLFDDVAAPLHLDVVVNPAAAEGAELLLGLASQPQLQVIFCDPVDGALFARRLMALEAPVREVIRLGLDGVGEGVSPDEWQRAVAATDGF